MTTDLSALPPEAQKAFQDLQARNLLLQAELLRFASLLKMREEQIRLLNLRLWGPKSEKLSDAQMALLLTETVVAAPEAEKEAALPEPQKDLPPPQAKKPRPNHPGRERLPEHLERREVIIPCRPEDCSCPQCAELRPLIGYETREELVCEPAKFYVRVTKREKRGCHCHEEHGVTLAPAPAQIVPKGKLSNEFIIEALAAKFQQHTPIYRQCAVLLEDHGIDLSRQTLNDAVLAAGQWLVPVVKAQAVELLQGQYIQADETTLPCQTGEKTGKNHRAYLWEYSHPGGLVVFDFQMGRGRAGPKEFLQGFQGHLQSDGYDAYDKLGEGIIYVACMAHIRREFFDAAKLAPLDPLPVEILAQFGRLYDIEREARAQGLGAEARRELRGQKSAPLMKSLKERITQIRQQINPGGALAKACGYALGQWSRMEEYLKDGRIEIDNNWCEGAMRPVALGRKNWLHLGSPEAGPKVAAIISIVETCRRLDIKLRPYLLDILPRIGDWPINRVAELTPRAWKAAQKS